jgi:hypothetical protein
VGAVRLGQIEVLIEGNFAGAVMQTKVDVQQKSRHQTVYASLLRFSPEAIPLRQRIVGRLVLLALEGSDTASPKRIGAIQDTIKFGSNSPELRVEILQDALDHLIAVGKVLQAEIKKRAAYYLTDEGKEEIFRVHDSAADLFAPVLAKLQIGTDPMLHTDVARRVYKNFICECFCNFGSQMARNTTREINSDQLVEVIDLDDAFRTAVGDIPLKLEWIESLRARCFSFIHSSAPEETCLKFALTQGYYLAHLLGLGATGFNPVAEDTFAESILYLDSNVLFVGLLSSFDRLHLFEETLAVAKRIGIHLRVTRATINEVRRVAADKRSQIELIVNKIPPELIERTRDSILEAYLERRTNHPQLTTEEFFQPFECLSQTISSRWGIEIIDLTADEIIGNRDFSSVEKIIQEQVLKSKPRAKSPNVLKHDIAHYALVQDARLKEPKTWFLTHDRSMTGTAALLVKSDEHPFCFSMLGFLQAISPFVTSDSEQHSISDLFNLLLGDQFVSHDKLFDMQELGLLSKMHEDVMSTPTDQLILAFDYVKSHILQGKQYTIEDYPRVALELKKFLTCSDDKRRLSLENQLSQLRLETERLKKRLDESDARVDASAVEIRTQRRVAEEYLDQNRLLLSEKSDLEHRAEKLSLENRIVGTTLKKLRGRLGYAVSSIGICLGVVVLLLASKWSRGLAVEPWKRAFFEKTLDLIGISCIIAFAVWLLRKINIHESLKATILAVVAICSIKFSGFATAETLAQWQAYIDVAVFVAGGIVVLAIRKKLDVAGSANSTDQG